jgi:hypothetical protein
MPPAVSLTSPACTTRAGSTSRLTARSSSSTAAIRRRQQRELEAEIGSKSQPWVRELVRQISIQHGRPGMPERQRWNASATRPEAAGGDDYDSGDPGPPSSPEIEAEVLAWRRPRGEQRRT